MKPGTQIIYIPAHAHNNPTHQHVEYGFVTSEGPRGTHFCRYWSNSRPLDLRTLSCSESTPNECLREYNSRPQDRVDALLLEIRLNQETVP